MYTIVTDSSCDLPSSLLRSWGVKCANLNFIFDDSPEVYDNDKMPIDEFYKKMRAGRVSRTSAIAGTMLGIKPAMYTADDGKLTVGAKVRGRRASLQLMCDKMIGNAIEPEKQTMIINHADCPDDAQWMVDYICARIQVGKILVLPMGPIIGAHVGPGCIALFYTGKTRAW